MIEGNWAKVRDPQAQFLSVPNEVVRDADLTPAAFRVMCYVLANRADWQVSQASIGRALRMDAGTVRRGLVLLKSLGYLLRLQQHSAAGRQADVLIFSHERLSEDEWVEELAGLGLTSESPAGEIPYGESPYGKTPERKKTNSKKTNEKKTNPPGGDDFAAAPDGGMFPEPEKSEEPKPEPVFSAAVVVAAYVDSYREKTGGDPTKRFIAQVGREAKALIAEGREPEAILAAAQALGRTAYPTLERQFAIAQHGGQASPTRRSMPGPGVVHTREEIAQQERAFAAMPAATMLSDEEVEAMMQELENHA